MDSSFYGLFGQVGATVVSIIFSLFVGYLLYIKGQRDRVKNKILGLRRQMTSIIGQLLGTAIPGVMKSLLAQPEEGEKWDKLSITGWIAGTSWEMRADVEKMNARDVWNEIHKGLENLVKGILPNGYFPEIETISASFRNWEENFIRNTEHIEWLCHEYAGYSWANSLIEKMIEWESRHPNPVLKSQDIALLIETIIKVRRLIYEDLLLEKNYRNLRIENAISHYRLIILGFLAMGFFSIFMPLLMLLLPPFTGEYIVSPIAFLCFILSSLLTMWLLMKSTRK